MQPRSRPTPRTEPVSSDGRIHISTAVPFILAHIVCLAAIFTGVHWIDLLIAVVLYAVRMFAITAGYHRYFAHRSYKTSRVFAFILAFLAQSSAQSGVLWWAGNHRKHHRHSDTADDIHSPVRRGFWYSHLGWIFTDGQRHTDMSAVPDLSKYPELVWLDRNAFVPPIALALLVLVFAGWSGLIVGFFWSTVVLWHATFSINSLAHVVGRRRYVTGDQSRNNWWLALLTFGEGWHNNHHHYQSAARQGFRWHEIDLSYYALKVLSWMGLVWDLHTPPKHAVQSEQKLRRVVIERAAGQLASSFQVEKIAADLRAVMAEKRASLDASVRELHDDFSGFVDKFQHQLDEKTETMREEFEQLMRSIDLPALPSAADFRIRAADMFVRTPSMNDIAERARQILIDQLCEQLLQPKAVLVRS